MSLPRITIITPSFNQAAYLEETILSVLEQYYPQLEYIIIDGGSTDGSAEIIKKYESRLAYWCSEKDRGQSEAINKGLKRATGDIIGWLCSDDLYCKGTLEKVSQLFSNNPDVCLIHGKAILFGKEMKERTVGAPADDLPERYFSVIPFPQPSSFFRKKVIDEQGYLDESLRYAMDYDLLVRIALHYPVLNAEDVFSKYRMHGESKTVKEQEGFLKEWCSVFSKFLRSAPGSEEYISKLKTLGMYEAKDDKYRHAMPFSGERLKRIVLLFLEVMAHQYYDMLDMEKVLSVTEYIKETDGQFYARRNVDKLRMKAKYLPEQVIKGLRKITR